MNYEYNNSTYPIIIIKKNNKNTYIRVNENLEVVVTTHYLVSKGSIRKLILDNQNSINKMIDQRSTRKNKKEEFFFFGREYNIIMNPNVKNVIFENNNIITPSECVLNKYIKKQISIIFADRMKTNYELFLEDIPYPILKIRTMKTRWGVCNFLKKQITLNYNLYMYDIICLDYVIIHELSHLVHHNHSPSFWTLVEKYCPNYKKIKKMLKE